MNDAASARLSTVAFIRLMLANHPLQPVNSASSVWKYPCVPAAIPACRFIEPCGLSCTQRSGENYGNTTLSAEFLLPVLLVRNIVDINEGRAHIPSICIKEKSHYVCLLLKGRAACRRFPEIIASNRPGECNFDNTGSGIMRYREWHCRFLEPAIFCATRPVTSKIRCLRGSQSRCRSVEYNYSHQLYARIRDMSIKVTRVFPWAYQPIPSELLIVPEHGKANCPERVGTFSNILERNEHYAACRCDRG